MLRQRSHFYHLYYTTIFILFINVCINVCVPVGIYTYKKNLSYCHFACNAHKQKVTQPQVFLLSLSALSLFRWNDGSMLVNVWNLINFWRSSLEKKREDMELEKRIVVNGGMRLPIGYRFHPTEQELILHYLLPKTFTSPLPSSIIPVFDVFFSHPLTFPGLSLSLFILYVSSFSLTV